MENEARLTFIVFIRLWTFSSSRTGGNGLMMTSIGTLWTSSMLLEWIDLLSFLSPVASDRVDIIDSSTQESLIFTRVTGPRKKRNIKRLIVMLLWTSLHFRVTCCWRRVSILIGSPSCQSTFPGNKVHLKHRLLRHRRTNVCVVTTKSKQTTSRLRM